MNLAEAGLGSIPQRTRWVAVVALIAGGLLLAATFRAPDGSVAFFASGYALAIVWIGAAVAAPRYGRREDLFHRRDALVGIGAGVASFAGFVVVYQVVQNIAWLEEPVSAVLDTADESGRVAVLVLALTNGVAEELFFRGTLVDAVRARWRWVAGVVPYTVATVASGNVALVLSAAAMGVLFTWLRLATRSVTVPALCHVTWSALMILAFPR